MIEILSGMKVKASKKPVKILTHKDQDPSITFEVGNNFVLGLSKSLDGSDKGNLGIVFGDGEVSEVNAKELSKVLQDLAKKVLEMGA